MTDPSDRTAPTPSTEAPNRSGWTRQMNEWIGSLDTALARGESAVVADDIAREAIATLANVNRAAAAERDAALADVERLREALQQAERHLAMYWDDGGNAGDEEELALGHDIIRKALALTDPAPSPAALEAALRDIVDPTFATGSLGEHLDRAYARARALIPATQPERRVAREAPSVEAKIIAALRPLSQDQRIDALAIACKVVVEPDLRARLLDKSGERAS